MNSEPIICFGQQPSGFFPKRFLVAKINTARALQKKIGGKIVFFYHDSDADYRETITIMRDKSTGAEVRLNFTQENKLQKKFSPLYLKHIPIGWKEEMLKQFPRFANTEMADIFSSVEAKTAGEFCLEMYKKLGLLDDIEVLKSSDKNFREQALELDKDYFADVEYEGEIVRAQLINGKFQLHEGGGKYTEIPSPKKIEKWQKNAGRETRFAWMNSVVHATHYIYGEGEKDYLKTSDFPEVKFVDREKIDNPNFAWLPNP
jgi:hypothetical protein